MNPAPLSAWRQLSAVSSTAAVLAAHAAAVTQLHSDDLPDWLVRLPAPPPGWRIAQLDAAVTTALPARLAVHGNGDQPAGSWDGIEAISVFVLSGGGAELADVVRDNADRTLRDLRADTVTTTTLSTSPVSQTAMRSSGYFNAGPQQCIWAQYSSYLTNHRASTDQGFPAAGQRLLVEHALFINAGATESLSTDIDTLSDVVHRAISAAARSSTRYCAPGT